MAFKEGVSRKEERSEENPEKMMYSFFKNFYMCKKKIMLFEENKGKWVHKTKNINMFGWLVKAETNLGYKKDYTFKMLLNPVG